MLVSSFLEQSRKLLPRKIALISAGQRFAYESIDNAANALANALLWDGMEKQERAAVYLDNSAASAVSIFAILKAGGVFTVINPQVKAKKLEYILNDCQAKVLVTETSRLQELASIIESCASLRTVILSDYELFHNNGRVFPFKRVLSFSDLLSEHSQEKPKERCIDIDLAGLIYTSGSTGNPKGVMLTHLNMVTAANSIIEYLENRSCDIIFDCLPLSFDYGLYQVLMAFKFGGTVVLEKAFVYPYQIIDLIVKEKVTGFPVVPAISAILLQLKNLNKFDFSNLRYITNTAQALPASHIFRLKELLPQVKLYSMYGLTECKRVSYLPAEQVTLKPASVGKAMPNTEAYIVDENGKRITEPDVVGELVVRGANVMKGYWNLPEETANRLKDGPNPGEKVLYTNDLFKMDKDGDLYFVSRKDDIIKTAGEMVAPKEVENVLYEIEDVIEAAAIGAPDEILGNCVKAFVVLSEGSALTQKEILLHCQKNLENFKVPKFIEFRKELPKTSTGKIRKKELV